MVFETQTPNRKAQNMAALLALILLMGIVLPIPIGAGFADWMNNLNAPDNVDTKYTEISTFDWDTDALYTGTGYKPYFNWWNDTDATKNKHNVNMSAHKLTADFLSTDGNQYANNYSVYDSAKDSPDRWDNGIPYWEVYFNYTAKQAYDEGVIKFEIALTSAATWENVSGGKGLLSQPEEGEDKEVVTITLSAGGVEFYTETLSTSGDGDVEAEALVDINDLRTAIMNGGAQSYFTLRVTGHDVRPIDMTDSAFMTYNVPKLFGRDDALYIVSMISVICAALGIFLVQPRYSLPFGGEKTRKRGY
jgi:hypothetical protein